ncbi:bromodomain protein, putative, partial [Plasmodium reichenowi]
METRRSLKEKYNQKDFDTIIQSVQNKNADHKQTKNQNGEAKNVLKHSASEKSKPGNKNNRKGSQEKENNSSNLKEDLEKNIKNKRTNSKDTAKNNIKNNVPRRKEKKNNIISSTLSIGEGDQN